MSTARQAAGDEAGGGGGGGGSEKKEKKNSYKLGPRFTSLKPEGIIKRRRIRDENERTTEVEMFFFSLRR